MKIYPSIPKEITRGAVVYAQDKLDGSCIRAEWSRKRGLYKFGTRKRLLGADEKPLGEAIEKINSKYSGGLSEIFRKHNWRKVVCFFEFFGPHSFAGSHKSEPHDVVLFDVAVDNRGILDPKDFIKLFKYIDTVDVLYHGKLTSEFIDSVKSGKLEGMTFEGVVCKGKSITPGRPMMFKIKSQAWINRLKVKCADNTKLFNELL